MVVVGKDQFFVHQHIRPARLVLQVLDLAHQPMVVTEKRRTRLPLAGHQRLADKNFPRGGRVHRPVVHPSPAVDRQAVERGTLQRHHLGALLFPVRFGLAASQQMRPERLQPLRLDAGDTARIQAGGLHQLGGHDPAPGFFLQARARVDPETDAACAQVMPLLALEPDIAQQAGHERAVDRRVTRLQIGRGIVWRHRPAQRLHHLLELGMNVAPFPHAVERQEVITAQALQFALRVMRQRLLEKAPQLEIGQKIGTLIRKQLVRGIGGLGTLHRTLARILQSQRRSDHQHFGQRTLAARCQDHASDARIQRQTRQLATELGELTTILLDRSQFGQQRITIGHRLGRRCIDKGKRLDLAQTERLHAQDHARQRRAQHLRIGVQRPRFEILFGIQTDADSGLHPAAAARALARRRLRYRLGTQLLDLVAIAVALDARLPRIHHIANARHGERGLGDIGGQHDAPAAVRREHPLLFLHRQPGEQRQDFTRLACCLLMMLAQHLGRLADLALTGQKHQHIALAFACQLIHRLGDGVVDVPFLVLGRGAIAHLHRIHAAGHFDHRCGLGFTRRSILRGRGKMPCEAFGIERGRGDDHFQIRPAWRLIRTIAANQLPQVPKQKIDVETALMRLVDDEGVVSLQQTVGLGFRQQDAIGHQLDVAAGTGAIVEADLVAHGSAQLALQFLRNATGSGTRSDAAWLGVTNQAVDAASEFETDLGQLGGLARAGFATDDDHRVFSNRSCDVLASRTDRQLRRKTRTRQRLATRLQLLRGVAAAKGTGLMHAGLMRARLMRAGLGVGYRHGGIIIP